jgi:hypothetical protein
MDRVTHVLKTVLTPRNQLAIHEGLNIALGITMGLTSVALAEEDDNTMLKFGIGAASLGVLGGMTQLAHPLKYASYYRNGQQFLLSLSNTGLGVALATLARASGDHSLMTFAWLNVALGAGGVGVQIVRELGCVTCPDPVPDSDEGSSSYPLYNGT